ncbi:DNA-binding response regulator [Bacterioplanes sanyensis]|uniref:DNA-binding response regulator n=1 Tax=Bacterioplanes sanyensis TaxID=1249553 RepID=A0A222FJU1_9GAMM|nr:response regulator transcription factor [Bacterioplanes sanyensis]ASP39009.1 DNA-binding response regulator [Bacterioplanes sanyensis]
MHVLLVEDDDETAAFIERGLQEAGHSMTHEATANAGLISAAAQNYDVIVFDRLLPGMDGLDAVRVLRQSGVTAPILLLTALDGIDDRVKGLEAGADDYLVKPFAFAELYARLRALARRQPLLEETQRRQIADLVLERTTQLVTRAGRRLELLPREYRILDYLMAHEGQIVTRTMLLETIWGFQFDPKTSLVQTHMSRLRNKVDKPFACDLIHTVRGAGYVISAPD